VEASNGLLNRFIITHQLRNKIVAEPLPGAQWAFEQMADAYRLALITGWGNDCCYLVANESSVELTMSTPAQDSYRRWYEKSQALVESAYVLALLAREPIFLRCYAAMLALLRGSLCVEADDIDASILLLDYWRGSLEFIFTQGRQTAQAQQMEDDLRRLLSGRAIGTACPMSEFKDIFDSAKRTAVLDWAQRQSPPRVSVVKTPTGGRPTELVTRLI
jgi:hypothetical protein